jgi:hypothetical protein
MKSKLLVMARNAMIILLQTIRKSMSFSWIYKYGLPLFQEAVLANRKQMPLVDGVLSTKMIRHYEKEVEELKRIRPRVPIIAVSASLTENSRFDYVETG